MDVASLNSVALKSCPIKSKLEPSHLPVMVIGVPIMPQTGLVKPKYPMPVNVDSC